MGLVAVVSCNQPGMSCSHTGFRSHVGSRLAFRCIVHPSRSARRFPDNRSSSRVFPCFLSTGTVPRSCRRQPRGRRRSRRQAGRQTDSAPGRGRLWAGNTPVRTGEITRSRSWLRGSRHPDGRRIRCKPRAGQITIGWVPRARNRKNSFSIREWNPLTTTIPWSRQVRARS